MIPHFDYKYTIRFAAPVCVMSILCSAPTKIVIASFFCRSPSDGKNDFRRVKERQQSNHKHLNTNLPHKKRQEQYPD